MTDAMRRRAMFGVMLAIFMGAMESTVVATAMPRVVEALGRIEMYSWVFSGFLLTSTVTMPLWGRLSDLYGRRGTFMTGLTIFLAGSALSGLSGDMLQLIVFRMLQGLGAGSLITIGMTIVGDLYGLERRAKMQGYISGVWGVASLVGPLLGGFLTDYVSWRWIFYINLPVGVIAMVLIAGALSTETAPGRRPVIDYVGLALFTGGISALLFGVLERGRADSWTSPDVLWPIAVAVVVLLGFIRVERRVPDPIVPLRLFGNRMVLAASVTGFLSGMAMFGAISFVPLFLQSVTGASAMRAGSVLTPFILGWTAFSVLSARIVFRVGYRIVVLAGMVVLTVAFVLFTRWTASLTTVTAMRDTLMAGIGMGCTMVPMLIAVQSAVGREDLGAATSMTQFFRTVGGAIGLSLMGAVMGDRLRSGLPMAQALHGVFVVGLLVCAIAVVSTFLVPAGRARDLAAARIPGTPTRAEG